jgi:glutamate N-acetyltransferase/amino-acid N-acetyltransferase
MYKILCLEKGLGNVQGFFCDATNVGMRTNPANSGITDLDGDVAFIRSEVPCDISAVFTSNTFQAAPIKHFQKYPKDFKTDFVLINAKNANAMTGEKGIEDIDSILSTLSSKIDVLNR